MILLQAHQISKHYGDQVILDQIQLEVRQGERVGLVGANGAGKSTLLKILTGEMSITSGEVMKAKQCQIGYLAQNSGLDTHRSIWSEMVAVFDRLLRLEQNLRQLESQMADAESVKKESTYQKLLETYSQASEAFKQQGGYQYEATIRNVLHGLRFGDFDMDTPISTLSGGQKTRLALAKLLLQQPDLLILDEPTNHLDLETLSWLETYLQSYPGGLLIVSHDRYFLDALVQVIYEIERHKATKYIGNYTRFLQIKAERYEQELKFFRKQQQEIIRLEDFVQRNIARASTSKRAQSRQKHLEKIERLERPSGDLKSASFSFEINRASGHDVLKVAQLSIGYEMEQPLAVNISFDLYKEDSVAIVGPNGVGKTTLLKSLVSELKPLGGSIQLGTNVSIAYYDQEHNKLRSNKTVLLELWDDYPHMLEKEVRTLLGRFLFSGDDVQKTVTELSGGEKARLTLAKLWLQKANLLIMDEPTNHLDIESKEVLEAALIDYPGTLLFVSHDRYFLNRIATKVLELSPKGTQLFLGDYDYYVQKKEELFQIAQLKNEENIRNQTFAQKPAALAQDAKLTYEQEKERQRLLRQKERKKDALELQIESLEADISDLEAELLLPDVYQDYMRASELQEQLNSLKEQLEKLVDEWSLLEEEMESI
jgi:ATP-binding cassette subfamily F protein 3